MITSLEGFCDAEADNDCIIIRMGMRKRTNDVVNPEDNVNNVVISNWHYQQCDLYCYKLPSDETVLITRFPPCKQHHYNRTSCPPTISPLYSPGSGLSSPTPPPPRPPAKTTVNKQ
jgi:hypothetical protein